MEIHKALLLMYIYYITVTEYACAADSSKNESIHIRLIKNSGSWFYARKQCIEFQGRLAQTDTTVLCSHLTNRSHLNTELEIWLGEHKRVSWIKSEGCSSIYNNSKVPSATSLQKCLTSCQTKYIGFQDRNCTCVTTMAGIKRHTNWNICKNGDGGLPIYTVQNISVALSSSDTNSCMGLYVNCSTAGPILTQENCLSKHTFVCDKNVNSSGIGTVSQQRAIDICKSQENGILLSDRSEICTRLNTTNWKTAWTSIHMVLRDSLSNDEDIDENTITKCSSVYLNCTQNRANFKNGNCNRNLQGFACEIKNDVIIHIASSHSSHFVYTNSIISFTSSQPTITEKLPDQTHNQDSSSSDGLQLTNKKTPLLITSTEKTLSTRESVMQIVTNGISKSTNNAHMSSSYLQTNTLITATDSNQHESPSCVYNSQNDNQGNLNKMQKNHEVISNNLNSKSYKLAPENFESPWDSNDNNMNSLVLEHVVTSLHNDSTYKIVDKTDWDTETDLNTYAVVHKPKKETTTKNEDIYNRDDVNEGDYNTLHQVFKPADQDLSIDNIYDSAFGARKSDDDTYNSLSSGIIKENTNDLYGQNKELSMKLQ